MPNNITGVFRRRWNYSLQRLRFPSAPAAVATTGDASLTLPQFTVDSTSLLHGVGSITLPQLEVNAASAVNLASITLPIVTLDSTALLHGVSSLTLPLLSLDALALNHGDASLTLPILSVDATSNTHGDSSITLPIFTVSSTSGAGVNEASITLPLLTIDGQGHLAADASITLPIFTVVAGDALGGDITLPMLTLVARGIKGSAPDCIVMNTINNAVSEYKGYWFNSFTKFNGVYLAANQNGIYAQDETSLDEEVYPIKSHIKTGVIDTYQDRIQRLRNAWLTFETDGDIRIRTRADEQATRYYPLIFQDYVGIKERRVKFERGIRQRHFDFKVENINGSDLQVDKLTVTLEPIVSKRR